MTIVDSTDRLMSVRNRCVIEYNVSVASLCDLTYALSVVWVVCHMAASDLLPFF